MALFRGDTLPVVFFAGVLIPMGSNASVQTSVYPTGEEVMNLARAIVNDAFRGGAGRILTDSAPFTLPYLNSAQRTLQDKLANNGVANFVKDNYQMLSLPAIQNISAGTQVYIDWQGAAATDGSFNDKNITLPQDMLVPLDLRERQAGQTQQQFVRMKQPQMGIPSRNQTGVLNEWEWRNDVIALVGATSLRDLQLRYEARLPLFGNNTDLSKATINIRDSADAMAWRVAYLFASARGAAQAAALNAEFEAAAGRIIVRNTRRDQRIQFRRGEFGDGGGGPLTIGTYQG